MKDKKNRNVYRFLPCSFFDVEGIESWLSDMALEGYFLEKDGFKVGFAVFEKREPVNLRYRLTVVGNGTRSAADEDRPEWEERIYYKEHGWDYRATYSGFHIYCTADPDAAELHTEPAVQALTFKRLRKQFFGLLIYRIILALLPLYICCVSMLSTMLRMRSWVVILFLACVIWMIADTVREALILRRVHQKLKIGIELERDRDWRKNSRKYTAKEIITTIAAIFLLVGMVLYHVSYKPDRNMQPIEEFEGDIPFATVADFAPNGRYSNDSWGNSNEFKRWSDIIAPVCIVWDEGARVYFDDGGEYGCWLQVEYYEMAAPWLARALVREEKRLNLHGYEFFDIEVSGADYAFIYYDYVLNIVIQDGNRVVHARVSDLGVFTDERFDVDLTEEDYIRIVAEKFLN
ncbi:MAG: DUF2812 domain-containing protein [Oscillospiraceae bacterium]|nr:DUF2812 domain-containing protein [Oscillospiraceae bacterium]